jgi:energy-coupling factor transporter ATP-binding protein EcfA2
MTKTFDHDTRVKTDLFQTFEAREAAFNTAVGFLIPARYCGPSRFWKDFRQVTSELAGRKAQARAYITSNPQDCLVFGSAEQVLAAAVMPTVSKPSDQAAGISATAARFGLQHLLHQPIRSLSGGETVRLALAKVMLAVSYCDQLIIASPFCWLSRKYQPLLDKVLNDYCRQGKMVRILAMDGEDNQQPMERRWLDHVSLKRLPFHLEIKGLRIQLGTPINALTAKPVTAEVSDFKQILTSPCLLVGDNGQGKSVLAKALSGALVSEGLAHINVENGQQRPRLLFQDVITQTLLRSPQQIAGGKFFKGTDPGKIFQALIDDTATLLQPNSLEMKAGIQEATTLLEVKAMLTAVRLAGNPAVLILDEPDWGLSRSMSIAFVLAVVRQCHQRGVPVWLISHKPWWRPLAGSLLEIAKTTPTSPEARFMISLKHPVILQGKAHAE